IGGTPEETSAEARRLTIPAARLQTGEALAADENPDAKVDIASKIPPAASVADVTVAGEAGKPLAEATAHISLASAISAQSIARGQPWTTLTFGAEDPHPIGRLREREYLRGGYRLSA
uniref:hypothetical protein n=1 Tax=Treponema endosymbiont of Eucomonympha sp. TaxID=1580831 RepID=UPI000A692D2C